MNSTYPTRCRSLKRKHLSTSVAALAAAMLTLGSTPELNAANWQTNPADQGVSVTVSNDGSKWTVVPHLAEGDALRIGSSSATDVGAGLTSTDTYYYVVGVGATPSSEVRFAQHPGGVGNITGVSGTVVAPKMPSWSNVGNWQGGIAPNGVDAQAAIVRNAGTPAILLDQDTTLGSLSVDTTAGSMSLLATARNGGPVSTLTLATSTGTPIITVTGGNSLSLSESKTSSTTPANSNGKLFLSGNQGLVIDNQNTPSAPVAINSVTTGSYAPGAVRFGVGLNWTNFSGDLTLARGVFQTLAGGGASTGISALPMRSKLILGTGSNTARIELAQANTQSSVRGLVSTSPSSSIINTSGGTGSLTFQVGSAGTAADVSDYAGNIGDTSSGLSSASAVRLVKVGPGTQILSGVNNINGLSANQAMVAINGGKLSLATTGALGTVASGQGTMNANSHIQLKNGEFEISGVGIATRRSQIFEGSLIFGALAANTSAPDASQSWQSTNSSILTVIAGSSQPTTLTFGSVKSRNFTNSSNVSGVTTLYRGSGLGSATAPAAGVASILFTTAPTVGGGFLFSTGSGASGTTQAPVIKGALVDTSPTGLGEGFATYEAGTGIRLLTLAEQNSVADGAAYNGAPSGDNILLNLASDQAITGHLSNTLELKNTSGALKTVTNTGTELNAANGLLFSGSSPIVLTGGEITGTASSNAEDVLIHSINSSPAGVTIQTPISNIGSSGLFQGWITYNGSGNFRIEGAQNIGNGPTGGSSTFSGIAFNSAGTTTLAGTITSTANNIIFGLNRGVVKLDTGATWAKTPRIMIAPEAKLDLNGQGGSATERRFSDLAGAFTISTLTFNASGGEVTNSAGGTPVDLILATQFDGGAASPFFGTITGNLNLVIDKSAATAVNAETGVVTYAYGSQTLAAANTYTGTTHIRSGTLNLTRYGQLPTSTVVTLGTTGGGANSTLLLGDAQTPPNLTVRQEIAGLYALTGGVGIPAVQNANTNVSQLILNIAEGVNNIYTGTLGFSTVPLPATPTTANPIPAAGHNSNLFGLRKIGAGSFEPLGETNYTGGTIIEGGIFRVSSDAKLGGIGPFAGTGVGGTITAAAAPMSAFPNQIILNGGTLQTTTTADFVLNAKRGIGLGPTSGSTGGTGTLWVDSGVNLSYSGIIASAGNTGTQTLVKQGAGTLTLNGTSTFTGTTQISAGVLAGTGSLASGLAINNGGVVAPGNTGVGTLTFGGNLTLASGAALNLDLSAPGTSDQLAIGGTVSATGTTTVNITPGVGFADGAYTLITASAPISASNFATGTGLPVGKRGVFSSVGNTLVVTISDAPALSAIESWRLTNFGNSANSGNGADAADPDFDGLANLIEYATGANPNAAGTSVVAAGRNLNVLTLTYTRIADTSLTYTVEGTSDLVTWTPIATSTGSQNIAGQVTVEDTVSIATAPGRRFLRLKVSR